jgi:hypothetical protein
MPLPPEHLLDELATAYVQAVAAIAGATIAVSRRDYGVDGTLKQIVRVAGSFIESGFPVDFQLQGTTTASPRGGRLPYDLKVRNYDLIVSRAPLGTPYYLYLVCFEGAPEEWFTLGPGELILRASAYWWTGAGPRSPNSSTVRIHVPLENRLTPAAIEQMLQESKERFEE